MREPSAQARKVFEVKLTALKAVAGSLIARSIGPWSLLPRSTATRKKFRHRHRQSGNIGKNLRHRSPARVRKCLLHSVDAPMADLGIQ